MMRVVLVVALTWASALSMVHAANPFTAMSNHVNSLVESVASNYVSGATKRDASPGRSRDEFKPLFIDCGSSANFTDSRGNVWKSDRHFANSSKANQACPSRLNGTKSVEKMYCSWRSFFVSGSGYDIPVPSGSYNVTLHFAEYTKEKADERVFDIAFEGGPRGSLDIIKATNVSKRACTISVAVNVTDGSLTIKFFAREAYPVIAGIVVQSSHNNSKNRWNTTKQWSNSSSSTPQAKNGTGASKQQSTPVAPPAPAPTSAIVAASSFDPIYIDCGVSTDYTDSKGRVWKADAHYSQSGQAYSECPKTISNASIDEVMYCSERWFDTDNFVDGPHSYEIPVPRGKYKVLMHFSENFYTVPEYRVFDLSVEGSAKQTVDIFKLVGSQRALVVTKVVTVLDDSLTINFYKVLEFPKIAAIEVHSADDGPAAVASTNFESMYIDCGSSDDYNDNKGNLWTADKHFSTASEAYKECPVVIENVTVDAEIYCSERWFDVAQEGPYAYQIPAPFGTYSVTLHFTENFYTKQGERVFDVAIENEARVQVDIVKDARGPKRAFILSAQTKVSDGFISVLFFPLVEFPKVTAIEIHAAGSTELSPLASSPGAQKHMYIRGLPTNRR